MLINDIMVRANDPHAQVKLNLLQTIAGRMGWNDLFEKLKKRYAFAPIAEPNEKPEPWWTR